MGSEERREYKRVHNEFNVRIAREVSQKSFQDVELDVAKSVNISANGILIHIKEAINIGDIIRVTFLKPNTFEFFEGYGKIVRIEDNADRTYLVGINFFELSSAEKTKLNYYVTLCE